MKTRTRLLAVSLLGLSVMLSTEVKASEKLNVTAGDNTRVFRFEINSPQSEDINLYLKNNRNKTIYQEKIAEGSTYSNIYDLSGVRNGLYTVVSEIGNQRYNRIFEVHDSRVELISTSTSFLPKFEMQDDMLLAHYINDDAENVHILIKDKYGYEYENNFSLDNVFSLAFSTDELMSGFYTLRLTSGGESFLYDFEVE